MTDAVGEAVQYWGLGKKLKEKSSSQCFKGSKGAEPSINYVSSRSETINY